MLRLWRVVESSKVLIQLARLSDESSNSPRRFAAAAKWASTVAGSRAAATSDTRTEESERVDKRCIMGYCSKGSKSEEFCWGNLKLWAVLLGYFELGQAIHFSRVIIGFS
jgi:hypothetical protein